MRKERSLKEPVFSLSTTLQSALTAVQGDVTSALAVIIPIAFAIAGIIWVSRKAFRWFKSISG